MYDQARIDQEVDSLLQGVSLGDDLDDEQVILLSFGLRACATALDVGGADEWMKRGLAQGIAAEKFHEIVTLMSAIGVHVFFESSRALAAAIAPDDGWGAMDDRRQTLWDKYVGSRKYWTSMQAEIPGFLDALLRMSPEVFEAFITFVGIPFKSQNVPILTKEIISMAADACPSHQYLPGMRMHLKNAIRMGAGQRAIKHAMRIAAESPLHVGVS
ncbi:carboxymuconolactone decarboxylase family protein [Saccharomonospora sp. NPDC046836]|uniref:carboxymuconolactone decarboxylase family protein n=1 Tax=Saccharomonospora sp. NPDC046836 TaxID=3156921 RepID=UPI0034074345